MFEYEKARKELLWGTLLLPFNTDHILQKYAFISGESSKIPLEASLCVVNEVAELSLSTIDASMLSAAIQLLHTSLPQDVALTSNPLTINALNSLQNFLSAMNSELDCVLKWIGESNKSKAVDVSIADLIDFRKSYLKLQIQTNDHFATLLSFISNICNSKIESILNKPT